MAQVPDIDVTTISVGGSAYTVPFAYQNRAEVFVEVDGVATAFTWVTTATSASYRRLWPVRWSVGIAAPLL